MGFQRRPLLADALLLERARFSQQPFGLGAQGLRRLLGAFPLVAGNEHPRVRQRLGVDGEELTHD